MKEDNIELLFKTLKSELDVNSPNEGHQERFVAKLNADKITLSNNSSRSYWKPFLAIAASLVICLTVFGGLNAQPKATGLASVSAKMSETQDFFTVTINEELKKLNAERSPLTENIIYDALRQLSTLENNYDALKNDLNESGNDTRVIYAMISNFQNRINLLTEVLDKIEDLKDLKTTQNETENTL
jgi:hypothetical protein